MSKEIPDHDIPLYRFTICGLCFALTQASDFDKHIEWHGQESDFLNEMQGEINGIVDTIIEHAPDWLIKGEK